MSIDNAHEQQIHWVNLHGTYNRDDVTRFLPIASPSGDPTARWRRVGEVFGAVVKHAFDNSQPLRADGSRWSLSSIGRPEKLALSLSAHDVCHELPGIWTSDGFADQLRPSGNRAMLISGSMKIHRINRQLAMHGLALQTSGASDGQTLAGATSAGTHGSAWKLGAIHDTVRAVHLMVAPDKALLLQPDNAPLTAQAATDLTAWLGFPTELVTDSKLFDAARVHLGALGLVLNMVVEVAPIYYLKRKRTTLGKGDDRWRRVVDVRDATHLGHHPIPHHIEVLLNPYNPLPARTGIASWVTSMEAIRYDGEDFVDVDPDVPDPPNSDIVGIVADLTDLIDVRVTNRTFRRRITKELEKRYGSVQETRSALPAVMFGPTSLPEGHGDSIEFAIDGNDALDGVDAVLAALDAQLKEGNQFGGGIGVRFVKGSTAHLATNCKDLTCFIELPGIRTKEIKELFGACRDALDGAEIAWGCHWGQCNLNTSATMAKYWGTARIDAWTEAREEMLSPKARVVFASPVLAESGLG